MPLRMNEREVSAWWCRILRAMPPLQEKRDLAGSSDFVLDRRRRQCD